MSTTDHLPTKADFLSNLKTFEHCDICHELFDETHVPTLTKCNHIFGSTCLQKWIDAGEEPSNACPKCREPMFVKPLSPLEFPQGERPDDPSTCWLEDLTAAGDAMCFFQIMRQSAERLVEVETVIYETDIEQLISVALVNTGRSVPSVNTSCLFIKGEHWPAMKEVVKELLQWLHQHRDQDMTFSQYRNIWLPKLTAAVGWEFS